MASGMASFWPLEPKVLAAITNPEILIGTIGYLFLKPLLKRSPLVDKTKGAYKTSMILYNVIMAVFSLACFIATTVALGWDRGYGKPLLDWAGDTPSELYTNSCPSPVYSSYLFTMAAKAFYYSKYVEYLDTVWLVIKGKDVSFLQTFHHFGAPWDVYLGCVHARSPWAAIWAARWSAALPRLRRPVPRLPPPAPAVCVAASNSPTRACGSSSSSTRSSTRSCTRTTQSPRRACPTPPSR